MSDFGQKFKDARVRFKDTQQAAARKMGVSISTVRTWEQGEKPTEPISAGPYEAKALKYIAGGVNGPSPWEWPL